MNKLKILFFDLETTPNLGYTWQKYEQNVLSFVKEWELLTFSWKFLGEKTVNCLGRDDFKDKSDKSLVKKLKEVIESADIVVAHNGDEFDIKKANAKFIEHNLGPTPPLQKIDTKKVAKRYFKFNSNSLDDLGKLLGVGRKEPTGGFQLWLDCIAGSKAAFLKMKKYNKQDVILLEKVYLKLRPWMDQHPNIGNITKEPTVCPKCGSDRLFNRGYAYNKTTVHKRYKCLSCGGHCRGRKIEKSEKPELV